MVEGKAVAAGPGLRPAYQMRLFTAVLTPFLLNLAIAIASAVVGNIVRGFIARNRKAATVLILLLLLTLLPASQAQPPPSSQPQYIEALIGAAMNDSTAIAALAFAKPFEKLGSLQPNSPVLKGLVGAVVLVVDGSPWSLPPSISRLILEGRGGALLSLMELVPPAVLVVAYDKEEASQGKAGKIASAFSEELGLSFKPLQLPSIDLENTTVFIYYFSGPVSKVREAVAERLRSYGDGLAEQAYGLYNQGVFTPGATQGRPTAACS